MVSRSISARLAAAGVERTLNESSPQPNSSRAMSSIERRARYVLAVTSWVMLSVVVVIIGASMAGLDLAKTPEPAATSVRAFGKILGGVGGFALLVAWASALWHATVHRFYSSGQRATVLAVLIFGNGVAAFFYYFTYVLWLPNPQQQVVTVQRAH